MVRAIFMGFKIRELLDPARDGDEVGSGRKGSPDGVLDLDSGMGTGQDLVDGGGFAGVAGREFDGAEHGVLFGAIAGDAI
jgi:hypothetical protein